MTDASFRLRYRGAALRDGAMDIRDLAPALLALGEIFEEANGLLNSDRAEVRVRINADFRSSSFEVQLDIYQDILVQSGMLLGTENVKSAVELIRLIIGDSSIAVGLFRLIKKLKSKPIEKVDREGDNVKFDLDGENITINRDVYNIYMQPGVRRAIPMVTQPIDGEEIDQVELITDGHTETITKDQAQYFTEEALAMPDDGVIISDEERDQVLEIIQPTLAGEYKWRLTDGDAKFTAAYER